MKYEIRRRARELDLDLVYAADERGFLSVEPYGQAPELKPFHGQPDLPRAPRDAYSTEPERLRALTAWLGGWDQVSDRSRRSLEQVGTTLGGYPQLASEARYAAGQIGHVARRLLLGERLPPFVGHLDLEQLLASTPADAPRPAAIARLWRGVTAEGPGADAYRTHFTTRVVPALLKLPGYRGSRLFERRTPDGVEFLVETLWESMEAVRAFAGDEPERAVIEPEARAVLVEHDETVRHYAVRGPTTPCSPP